MSDVSMPELLSCPNCKGALSISKAHDGIVTCEFCGHDVSIGNRILPRASAARGGAKLNVVVISVLAGLVVLVGVVGVVLIVSAPRARVADDAPRSGTPVSSGGVAIVSSQSRISGGLSRDDVITAVSGHLGALSSCNDRRLRDVPSMNGRIVWTFTITTEGRATEVGAQSSTVEDPALRACVEQAITEIQFPRSPGGPSRAAVSILFRSP